MTRKKWVTWVIIAGIGLLPLPAAVPYLQTYIVRNAVVTAFCYEVRAPIDGVVEGVTAKPGNTPGDGPVLTLENRRIPLSEISSRKTAFLEKKRYKAALETERATLNARLKKDQDLLSGYVRTIRKDLEQSLAILASRRIGETARLKEVTQTRERIQRLVTTSVAAQEDADRIEAAFQEAQARVTATGLEITQVGLRLKMLSKEMFPPDLSDGVLQVQNRINALYLDLMDCKRRIHAADAGLSEAKVRWESLQADLDTRIRQAEVRLPETAVIWDVDVKAQMEVAKGDRLLSYIDRSRLMVEVAVDDATLELIREDHPVRIRLFGSPRFIAGTVIQIMGSAGNWPGHRFAATVRLRSPRDGRVLVAIDDDSLENDVRRLCGVGRTAYAEFEGIGLVEQYFGSFLR